MDTLPEFFGLLHVAADAARPVNFKGAGDPIDVYIRCAALCARSFTRQGYRFRLITNTPERVKARSETLGLGDLVLAGHDFEWQVPKGVSFYSAHFKLELFEAFGQGRFGAHVGLVDLDTVLLRPFSDPLISHRGLVGYEITACEVRDYGAATIAAAVSEVVGEALPPCWWGGEFLLGRIADFAKLSSYVAKIWPRYVETWRTLHHQGDEALTTAAIAMMGRDGIAVLSAGDTGEVHRWWSARTLSKHAPLNEALGCALLHLPADKDFLSAQAETRPFETTAFVAAYRRLAWRKSVSRRLIDVVQQVRPSGPRKYAPRIG